MKFKYVMTDRGPIIFPGTFAHDEFMGFCPTSAAMVNFFVKNQEVAAECLGESVSLGMKAGETDSEQICGWLSML